MGSKQDDHNRGQRDGSKASGFDTWIDLNNPLNSEEYKAGYRQALQQRERTSVPAEPGRGGTAGTREGTNQPLGQPSDSEVERGSGWSGGGGGGGIGFGGEHSLVFFLILLGCIIAAPFYIAQKIKERFWPVAPQSLDIVVYDAERRNPVRFVDYNHGRGQSVNLFVTWQGKGTYLPVTVSVLRDGTSVFSKQFKTVDMQSNELLLPYTPNQSGSFLARIAAEGAPVREYEFAVGVHRKVGGIDLGGPPVEAAAAAGLRAYVTDSFVGPRPWPPKNVIYAVRGEPNWLYAVVQSDSASGSTVQATIICGRVPLLTQPVNTTPNSTQYLTLRQVLEADHCAQRVYLGNGTDVTFPFIIVEVEHDNGPTGYKLVADPDATPPTITAWLQRGLDDSRAGQHDAAIRDFSVMIPDEIAAFPLRGDEYAALGDYERAIADYDYALRWQPHNVSCLVSRGSVYASMGNYARAVVDFKEAIRISPQNQSAIERLSQTQQDLAARATMTSPTQQSNGPVTDSVGDTPPDQEMPNFRCYTGTWVEGRGDGVIVTWSFRQDDRSLLIHRDDADVYGTFTWLTDHWTGNVWRRAGGDPFWDRGVELRANLSCTKIATNRPWWYERQ